MAKINFRFIELEHELHLIERYISMLELHLPDIVESERKHLYHLYENSPPEERGGLEFLEHDLDQGIPTRAFVASAIMGLWAVYETSATTVSRIIQKAKQARLSLDDLRGDFLHRASSYFDDILRFSLHVDKPTETRLHHLATVRNAFAHTGGRIAHVPPAEKKRLLAAIAATPGLAHDSQFVLAGTVAARHFHETVERDLADLFQRTRAEF